MTDRIIVKDLQIFTRIGVNPEEKTFGQRFFIDLNAEADLKAAGTSDDYNQAICYGRMSEIAIAAFTARPYNLIEAAAEAVAAALLAEFPAMKSIIVEVRKPSAPIEAIVSYAAVIIERRNG